MGIDYDGYCWLTSDAGRAALAEWSAHADRPELLVPRLRKSFTAQQTHWLVEQLALRRRAVDKFATPNALLFTPVGLEQATDEWVAQYKASRFTSDSRVIDLCCGIGGDLRALARRGPAVGVDRDRCCAAIAAYNSGVSTLTIDVSDADVAAYAAWHIDPDRRPDGRRTTRVIDHQPGLDVLASLLHRNPHGAIKLAPAAEWPSEWNDEAEFEWISRAGQVRQLIVWFGNLARHRGQRVATIVDDHGHAQSHVTGSHTSVTNEQSSIGAWLFEPDPAVIAAGLVGALACELRLQQPTPGIAYLTGESYCSHPALTAFAVHDVVPFDLKRLKRCSREQGWNCVEVKKRGVEIDPAQVLRQLRSNTGRSVTLIVLPQGERVVAAICERSESNLPSM